MRDDEISLLAAVSNDGAGVSGSFIRSCDSYRIKSHLSFLAIAQWRADDDDMTIVHDGVV